MKIIADHIITMGTNGVIPDGILEVQNGFISGISNDHSEIIRGDKSILDLSGHIILPAFINAHAHLDLSFVKEPLVFDGSFTNWLKQIIDLRKSVSKNELIEGLSRAQEELLKSGTFVVGDYVGDLRIISELINTKQQGRVFCELIGNTEETILNKLNSINNLTKDFQNTLPVSATPHSIYSINQSSLRNILTAHNKAPLYPLAIHCAESEDEWEYITSLTGRLAELMQEFGFGSIVKNDSPVDYLHNNGGIPKRSMLIHCNYLLQKDYRLIKEADCTIVHCPQSHEYFGHKRFPLNELLDHNIPIALGTDGRVCCEHLNIHQEMKLLRRQWPALSAKSILAMATVNGANGLWLEDKYGVLDIGRSADLIAVPNTNGHVDPYEAVILAKEASFVMKDGNAIINKVNQ